MRPRIEECAPHVYRFALRLTGDAHRAEDLTQDVMLRAWRQRRQLRDVKAVRTWIFRIAANMWKDELRRTRTAPERHDVTSDMAVSTAASPARTSMLRENVSRCLTALDQLPERQRSVVYLHVCEQLSLGEIAEVLSISYAATKASLSAGRRQLRATLRDVFQDLDRVFPQ